MFKKFKKIGVLFTTLAMFVLALSTTLASAQGASMNAEIYKADLLCTLASVGVGNGHNKVDGATLLGGDVNSSHQHTLTSESAGTTVGNFEVIGGTNGVDYSYANNTLSVLTSTALTITQTSAQTSIADTIFITKDVQANITLDQINIDVSALTDKSPIVIEQSSTASVTITIKENTTTILKSGTTNEGIKRALHTQSLTINNNGNLIIDSAQASAIDGGYVASGVKDVVFSGGYIKLSGAPKVGNSTSAIAPVNASGQNLYEIEIQNTYGSTVTIDGNCIESYYGKADCEPYYTFLTGTDHTIKVGTYTTLYHCANSAFSACSAGTEVGTNDQGHWKKCFYEDCDEQYDYQNHNYTQRRYTADYLKSEPTCTQNRLYYYSCSCGKKTTNENDYFEESNTKLGHNYTKPDGTTSWVGNDDCHWNKCLRCQFENNSTDFASHTFDRRCGDCTCTVCGKVVVKPHNILREYHWMYDASTHWYGCHFRTDDCDAKDSEAPHNFSYVACSGSDIGYHIKRCSVCWYEDQSSKQACTAVITDRTDYIHIYSCSICNTEMSREYHDYTNVCDETCDTCGKVRTPEHDYDNSCDTECNLCHATREPNHVYSDDCDETCNNCDHTRTVPHFWSDELFNEDCFYHFYGCENCYAIKDAEPHVYDGLDDLECNTCGYQRGTPITELKLFLTGYRYGSEMGYSMELYSYSSKIEYGYMNVYFSTDARMIEFGQDFEDYIIDSNPSFFEDKAYYCFVAIEPKDGYDIASLSKQNVKLVVNGTTLTAENVMGSYWGGDPCALVGFALPKLEIEGGNEADADLNFKLLGYEFGNKAEDISVELLSNVAGINFDSNATYGNNYFITTEKYPYKMFMGMVDGNAVLEANKQYYLALNFNTKANYYFDDLYDYDLTLQGCGNYYSMDSTDTECLVTFRLHPLGATKINNINFAYSNYAVDELITSIAVDYSQAVGVKSCDGYYDEEEYEYNYQIVTNLNNFLNGNRDDYDYSYVNIYDNGRFISNKQYYLVINVTPASNAYSLQDFETATVTFNGQNATQVLLIDAGFAYAIYQLPVLTEQDTVQKITELEITISNYQLGKTLADLTYQIDTTYAVAIEPGGDEDIESTVTIAYMPAENNTYYVGGGSSRYTLTASYKYFLSFTIKAKDGVSFYNLTKNNVTVTALKEFEEFYVSAGGGYLEFTAELRLLSDYHEHNFVNAEQDFALKTSATCLDDAVYYKSCSCGELSTQTFTKANSKLGHLMSSDWTASNDGHYHACSRTGCTYQEDFASHTANIESATQTDSKVCTECGYVIEPALSHTHTLTLNAKVDATCLSNGTKAYYYCSGCEAKFENQTDSTPIANFETWVVLTGEHSFGSWQAEVPATCLASGTIAHKTCSTCQKHFDQAGNELLNINILKLPHSYDGTHEKTWPSCSTVGTKWHRHCTLCNKNYDFLEAELTDTTIPVNSRYHSYEFVATTPATCLADGVASHYKCSECNALFSTTGEPITAQSLVILHGANAHVFADWVEQVSATCTSAGQVAHKDCVHCHKHFNQNGEEISETNLVLAINPNAHTFGAWQEEVPATTSKEGIVAHKDCTDCHKHFNQDGVELQSITIDKLSSSSAAVVLIAVFGTIALGVGGFSVYWFAIKKRKFKDIAKIFTKNK